MISQVTFIKNGYDSFIDFIKAYAIICVLISHTCPSMLWFGNTFWAEMQVPLFILVQTFHYFKKESKLDAGRLLKRIVLPFVVVSGITFLIQLLIGNCNIKNLITSGIENGGGYGPGSYYPLVYIQIALLLVCFRPLFSRYNKQTLLWLFLLISEACEIACSFLNVSDSLYRLLAVRYIFLLYLGWLWVKEGIIINWKTIVLCLLSCMTIVYFQYLSTTINNEPWFYNTAWKTHRWPCYFYVSHGLVLLLYYVWQKIRNKGWVCNVVKKLASASYEIFLIQMAVLALFKTDALLMVKYSFIRVPLWLVIVWSVSIFGGFYFHKVYKKII